MTITKYSMDSWEVTIYAGLTEVAPSVGEERE